MLPAGAQPAPPTAIGQPPLTSRLVMGAPQPTPTISGPVATTLAGSPTTTQAPTTTQIPTTTQVLTTTQAPTSTTVPAGVNDSPDEGGDADSQGGSGEIATGLQAFIGSSCRCSDLSSCRLVGRARYF